MATHADWKKAKAVAGALGLNVSVFDEGFMSSVSKVTDAASDFLKTKKSSEEKAKKASAALAEVRKIKSDYEKLAKALPTKTPPQKAAVDKLVEALGPNKTAADWRKAKEDAKKAGIDVSKFKDDYKTNYVDCNSAIAASNKEKEALVSLAKVLNAKTMTAIKTFDSYQDKIAAFDLTGDPRKAVAAKVMTNYLASLSTYLTNSALVSAEYT